MSNLFTFQFQVYQNKPVTWLHNFLFFKILGNYFLIILYINSCIQKNFSKIGGLINFLIIIYYTLCLSTNSWRFFDIQILRFISLSYFINYFKSIFFIASLWKKENIFKTKVVYFSFFKPFNMIYFDSLNIHLPNLSLYVNTLIYMFISKILLFTLNSEELVVIIPIFIKSNLSDFFTEIKIIILISVQLLSFNYSIQKNLWKLVRNRQTNNFMSLFLFLFLLRFYLSSSIKKTQEMSTLLYARNNSNISISFLTMKSVQFFN